jgi:hypothetical protein
MTNYLSAFPGYWPGVVYFFGRLVPINGFHSFPDPNPEKSNNAMAERFEPGLRRATGKIIDGKIIRTELLTPKPCLVPRPEREKR